MLKIISTKLKKIFWISKGKPMLVCLLDQVIACTCPFSSSNQAFNSQLDICPYLQERAIKSFIL